MVMAKDSICALCCDTFDNCECPKLMTVKMICRNCGKKFMTVSDPGGAADEYCDGCRYQGFETNLQPRF